MHAATEVLGMMASLTSFLLWLPQGARVWKYRDDPAQLQGIVLSTQVISLAGNVLWGVYAILIGSFWLGAPALVNGPIAVATIVVVTRGARRSTSAAPVGQVPATAGLAATPGAAAVPVVPVPAVPVPAASPVAAPTQLRTPTGTLRIVDVRQLAVA